MSNVTWVYIFLGIYIVYCFYWGLKGYFTEKTSSGYAIAGRSIPFFAFLLAATAASFSGWTFIGHPGLIWRDGLAYAFASFYVLTIPITGAFFGKRTWLMGKRYGFITPGDMYAYYYNTEAVRWLVVLTAFLLFAGAGSLYSQRLVGTSGAVSVAVAAIAVASIVYLLALDRLLAPFASLADSLRILVSVLLIAPLAFFMGLPFPLGITRVGQRTPALIPWAWGINGCASVISAVLATLLAMHFGFTVVVMSAVLLYGVAAVSVPR